MGVHALGLILPSILLVARSAAHCGLNCVGIWISVLIGIQRFDNVKLCWCTGDLMETEDHELQRAIELSLVAAEQQTEVGRELFKSVAILYCSYCTLGRFGKQH